MAPINNEICYDVLEDVVDKFSAQIHAFAVNDKVDNEIENRFYHNITDPIKEQLKEKK